MVSPLFIILYIKKQTFLDFYNPYLNSLKKTILQNISFNKSFIWENQFLIILKVKKVKLSKIAPTTIIAMTTIRNIMVYSKK